MNIQQKYHVATLRISLWKKKKNNNKPIVLRSLDLTELPPIPLNCKILYCDNNKLTSLPALPNCEILTCTYNLLSNLPGLPKCQELYCYENKLTSLPPLPNCKILFCHHNKISQLSELSSCTYLLCSHNELTNLPNIDKCTHLSCQYNKLSSLPQLSSQCDFLFCNNNELTELPDLPNCKTLDCHNNKLTSLPKSLNPKISLIRFHHNSLLTILPNFPTIVRVQHEDSFEYKNLKTSKYLYLTPIQRQKYNLPQDEFNVNYTKAVTKIQRMYRNKNMKMIKKYLSNQLVHNIFAIIDSYYNPKIN